MSAVRYDKKGSRGCPFSKNEEIKINIDDIGVNGEGIGHTDGYAFFINGAVPGDHIRAKVLKANKNYGYAKLLEIISPSPYRTEPACKNADKCGGCTLQHLTYEKQLEYKENKVKNCLIRIGGIDKEYLDSIMQPIIGMENPYNYRNKAQFPVGQGKNGETLIGFFAGRTHDIIDTSFCCIQSEIANHIMASLREWIKKSSVRPYDETSGKGDIRHIIIRNGYATGEIMVCLVVTHKDIKGIDLLIEELVKFPKMTSICLNINSEKTNKIMGPKVVTVYGRDYIEDKIGDVRFRISPLSFYQVNPVQTEKLYRTALDYASLTGREIVWDMYCGIGTISLFLAIRAKAVLGVEIVPQAIEDAKKNAEINDINNALFLCGAAEEIAERVCSDEEYSYIAKPDVIVVDPPRKGCDKKLLDTILNVGPKRVVYVSCDPATLARDVKILCDGGYELVKARACDMFGMSGHVESVCVLGNKNRKLDDYLRVEIDVDKIHDILDKEEAEREAKEKSQSE